MITPEIPEEINKKAAQKIRYLYGSCQSFAESDANVILSAVYSGIRRQAFEEALREAAYDLRQWESAEAHMGQEDCEGPHGATAAYRLFESAIEDPAQWLLDRADSIVRSLAGEGTP